MTNDNLITILKISQIFSQLQKQQIDENNVYIGYKSMINYLSASTDLHSNNQHGKTLSQKSSPLEMLQTLHSFAAFTN